MARYRIRCHHRFSLSFNCAVRSTRRPSEVFSACCNLLNTPTAPGIYGTALLRIPKSQNNFRLEIRLDFWITLYRAEESLSLIFLGRLKTNFILSIDQLRTVLMELQFSSPLANLFRDIGSSLALSWGLLRRKKSSMERNS